MKHIESKKINKNTIIKCIISLDNSCNNGHEDFSITFNEYHKNELVSFGCSEEIILKHFPQYKEFIPLHTSDYSGIPMYPISNGFYHLKHSLESVTIKYLRLKDGEYNELNQCLNKLDFFMKLVELKIIERWKFEAEEVIKKLEILTGEIFISKANTNHMEWEKINTSKQKT